MVPVNYNNALICRTLIHVRECNFGCYLLQQIVTKYVFRRLLLGYVSKPSVMPPSNWYPMAIPARFALGVGSLQIIIFFKERHQNSRHHNMGVFH